MTPAKSDITIWRGNDYTLPIDVLHDADGTPWPEMLENSSFILRIAKRSGEQIFRQEGQITGNRIEFSITNAETALFPTGVNAISYEIERRIGEIQETWLYGAVITKGGVND